MAHVLVLGSGIAGLTAALHAAEAGFAVTLATKGALGESNTAAAQGGIAGVMFSDDAVAAHVHDTISAGAGLVDPAAAQVLCEQGPERIRELIARGVRFDLGPDGSFARGLEAAHSYPRILHAGGDATGAEIQRALLAQLDQTSTVHILEHTTLDALLQQDPHRAGSQVVGARLVTASGTVRDVVADAVILATGGAGQLFTHTSNPPVATGDGIAAALRAGAHVQDLEFMQFHPTVFAGSRPFLISEAVRGEGAVLRDAQGHRFMPRIHPDAELAPRNVVAQAITATMRAQGGTLVFLDATALARDHGPEFLQARFPSIAAALTQAGFDWNTQLIPVTPAAHYLMGGVRTDLAGRTSLPGLYAAGEVACTRVHGANRLASNSLLEGAVFAARLVKTLKQDLAEGLPIYRGHDSSATASFNACRAEAAWPAVSEVSPEISDHPVDFDPAEFTRQRLQRLMWECAGIERSAAGLTRARTQLATWAAHLPVPTNSATREQREDANLLLVAQAMVAAALARPDSVGAHQRIDTTSVIPREPVIVVTTGPASGNPSPALSLTSQAVSC